METPETNQSPYVAELKVELTKIDSDDFVHATRMLTEEMKRVESGDKYKIVPIVELHHDRPHSNALKIRIPAKEYPKVNFSGKLLGPKGSTLKQLQQETGCKLSILGKGSMRDKTKEEELRKEGGKYAHLNEELHLLVECFAETVDAYGRLANAVAKLKEFMNPESDPQQLQDMMGGGAMEGGYFNGEAPLGRGGPGMRGGPPGRGLLGAPGGRGGMPPGRGGVGGPPPRGAPPTRGGPGLRGAPGSRGAPAPRGAGAPRGMPAPRGAPAPRGGPSQMRGSLGGAPRGAPPTRGAPAPRGVPPPSRGRGMAPPQVSIPSRAPAIANEYEDYGAETTSYSQDPYSQTYTTQAETYDDGYTRRDQYAEETYAEPAQAAGWVPYPMDTQYFDYGHGTTAYDEYADTTRTAARAPLTSRPPPASSAYDRSALKAPPPMAARARGGFRAHPYESRPATGGY